MLIPCLNQAQAQNGIIEKIDTKGKRQIILAIK
jgi:hypothetical protein